MRLKHWLVLLVFLPGGLFAAGSLFLLAYANLPLPLEYKVRLGPINDEAREVIVLVHGKGDNPSSWADDFARRLRRNILGEHQQVVTVDWEEYSRDIFRSTLHGRRIGKELGRKLGSSRHIERLHLIGHSAGSFVVYGICEAVKKMNPAIYVQSTYLDPVTVYRAVDWEYGTRHFGQCADVSDAYIDRDDEVPGSNSPLPNAHTFDITGLKAAAGFTGLPHLWPIAFYRREVLSTSLPFWQPDQAVLEKYPVGAATIYPHSIAGRNALWD